MPTKICLVKAMFFFSSRVWMWESDYKESWAPKNWCFWTVVLKKTLESPLDGTARRPNQSILKKIKPECWKDWCWSWSSKLHFGHLMWRDDSMEKTLMLGKNAGRRKGDDRGWDGWMASPTQWTRVRANFRMQWKTGKPGLLQSIGLQSWTRLSDWTTPSQSDCEDQMYSLKQCLVHRIM